MSLKEIQDAGEAMARRLRIFKGLALRHRDMGDTDITLALEELFEPADEKALDDWEKALANHQGFRPLPLERAI